MQIRTVTLVYIFLELFPFEVVSCLLYNLKTFQGIFMKLHRNVKHHQTMCRIFALDFVSPPYHLNKCHKGICVYLNGDPVQTAGGDICFFLFVFFVFCFC